MFHEAVNLKVNISVISVHPEDINCQFCA